MRSKCMHAMRENVCESTTPIRIQMKCNQTRKLTEAKSDNTTTYIFTNIKPNKMSINRETREHSRTKYVRRKHKQIQHAGKPKTKKKTTHIQKYGQKNTRQVNKISS